jgi:DNA-binding NarL/FixJ family response regulator
MNDLANIGLLIADGGVLFRCGLLVTLKEHRPNWRCMEADSADAMLAQLRTGKADLLLYDTQLGGQEEIANLRQLRAEFPDQPVLAMANSCDRTMILECLAAGANGYILKSTSVPQLLLAIRTVLSGAVFAPAVLAGTQQVAPTAAQSGVSQPLSNFTERQMEVFQLLSEGCSTKTIARRLGLGIGTVKVHLAAIYRALDAHSRVQALVKANYGISPSRTAAERARHSETALKTAEPAWPQKTPREAALEIGPA